MHRAARQHGVSGRCGQLLLEGHLVVQQVLLVGAQEGLQLRGHGLPPGQAAQIGLVQRKVGHRVVHARQQMAQLGAMVQVGRQLVVSGQAGDQRRGLAGHLVQHLAISVGARLGHRQTAAGQVLHQAQVERQLLGAQALEQRQHPLASGGGDEVIGVFDARGDALELQQAAAAQAFGQSANLGGQNFGEHGHRGTGQGDRVVAQKVNTGQRLWPTPSRPLDGSLPAGAVWIS